LEAVEQGLKANGANCKTLKACRHLTGDYFQRRGEPPAAVFSYQAFWSLSPEPLGLLFFSPRDELQKELPRQKIMCLHEFVAGRRELAFDLRVVGMIHLSHLARCEVDDHETAIGFER
jgi:hypothetical protein